MRRYARYARIRTSFNMCPLGLGGYLGRGLGGLGGLGRAVRSSLLGYTHPDSWGLGDLWWPIPGEQDRFVLSLVLHASPLALVDSPESLLCWLGTDRNNTELGTSITVHSSKCRISHTERTKLHFAVWFIPCMPCCQELNEVATLMRVQRPAPEWVG